MINTEPWRTVVNANPLAVTVAKRSNLTVVKQASMTKSTYARAEVAQTKRYSFDDNGGGYQGL